MSPPFHYFAYRTFVHSTEDPDKVLQALRNVVGDVEPEGDRAEGFYGNPMMILSGRIEGARAIDELFDRLEKADLVEELRRDLDVRLDEENQLHLRLDKDAAYAGDIGWADRGDVVAVWGKVEAYPAKREKALDAVQAYLDEAR